MIPAGSQLSFQVDTGNDLYGHSWTVKTKANSANLYIHNSFSEKSVHVSHHDSGQWHVVFPPKNRAERSTYLAITKSRDEYMPGWFQASRIVVMREDAVLKTCDSDAIKVPFHSEFLGLCIDFFISEKSASPFLIEPAFSVASMELGQNHQLEIVARPYSVTESPYIVFSNEIQEAIKEMQKLGWGGEQTSIIYVCDADEKYGYIQQIEIRIP